MRVVWDCGALCCYEGFCCFAFGLCGLLVDVWGWEWLVSLGSFATGVSDMRRLFARGTGFAYMGVTRGLSLLRA